jgi:hypothetical protein
MKLLTVVFVSAWLAALVSLHCYRRGCEAGYSQGWADGENAVMKTAVERKVAKWDLWSQQHPEPVLVWRTDARWEQLPE